MHTTTKHWAEKLLTGMPLALYSVVLLQWAFFVFLSFAMRLGASPLPWSVQAVSIALGPIVYVWSVYAYHSSSRLASYYHAALFANALLWMWISVSIVLGLLKMLFLPTAKFSATAGVMVLFFVFLFLSVIDWYLTRSGISIAVIAVMLFMALLVSLKMMQLRREKSFGVGKNVSRW
jgi:hypothetical protein